MPLAAPGLGGHFHGVEYVGNLPVAEPLFPERLHFLYGFLLALVGHLAAVHDPAAIG